MKRVFTNLAVLGCLSLVPFAAMAEGGMVEDKTIEHGRYLLTVSGCNDCHTSGYAQNGGNIPESERFLGSSVGFKGPWGTTYPSNLRLLVANMSEEQWLVHARQERRPPMPWFNLRDMTDKDLIAMYQTLRYLGPKGGQAPAYVPPDGKVETAYIYFVPQQTAKK